MHKEDILKNAKFYERFLNKQRVYLKSQDDAIPEGPFYIEEIKIEWLDIPKTIYDMRYILRHEYEKRTVTVKEGDIIAFPREKRGIFNKIPKYNVNDIVIIEQCIAGSPFGHGYNVVGIINDVFNHRDTGEVFYHIIFNSGTPRKFFEHEINDKINTDLFKDGQSMHKQLLAKMYHTNHYDYLSEKEVIAWAYTNFEVRKEEIKKMVNRYNMANMMYPVRDPLKDLEELNKRQMESIMAETIRIDIDDAIKANYSKEVIEKMINNTFGVSKYEYKKIIFSGPCTIILWKDGTKTIAKTSGGDIFDPEKGVAICFMKKMLGHTETNKVLRKAHKQYEDYLTENGIYPTLDLKDLHALEPTEYRLNFVNPIARVSDINPNSAICIDQSAIEEVKKLEEEQDESK